MRSPFRIMKCDKDSIGHSGHIGKEGQFGFCLFCLFVLFLLTVFLMGQLSIIIYY